MNVPIIMLYTIYFEVINKYQYKYKYKYKYEYKYKDLLLNVLHCIWSQWVNVNVNEYIHT